MKALHAANTPRSTSTTISSRFRPLSLPLYLDYKTPTPKQRTVDVAPAPVVRQSKPTTPTTPQAKHGVSGSIQLPRILRGPIAVRSSLLPKPTPTPTPNAFYHPQRAESRCCQMLMQGLFVAFEDDSIGSGFSHHQSKHEDLLADGGRPFTHFISLSTRYSASIAHAHSADGRTRSLRLRLPRLYSAVPPTDEQIAERVHAARLAALSRGEGFGEDEYYNVVFESEVDYADKGFTQLEALQLLAVRDFLSTAGLDPDLHSGATARVLVTTPRDHRTDAIAAVMGYLSLVLGHPVAKLLRTQNSHPRILSIWKYAVSDECAVFIQDVARL
ncbi:hypothetical protein C8F01DRAFT_1076939 [Mycena amicta]|nr:hypothetical protein C8F01DRAFT_1076939 [Mycena amicta]